MPSFYDDDAAPFSVPGTQPPLHLHSLLDSFMWWSTFYVLLIALLFSLSLWFGCRGAMTYLVQKEMIQKQKQQQQQQKRQQHQPTHSF